MMNWTMGLKSTMCTMGTRNTKTGNQSQSAKINPSSNRHRALVLALSDNRQANTQDI